MVASGLGAAFLPMLYTRTRLTADPSVVLRELSDYPLVRTIGMCWRRSTPQSHRFQSMAEVIMTAISEEWPEAKQSVLSSVSLRQPA
jgi:DNA-binding transcriptional LysR family regulator